MEQLKSTSDPEDRLDGGDIGHIVMMSALAGVFFSPICFLVPGGAHVYPYLYVALMCTVLLSWPLCSIGWHYFARLKTAETDKTDQEKNTKSRATCV